MQPSDHQQGGRHTINDNVNLNSGRSVGLTIGSSDGVGLIKSTSRVTADSTSSRVEGDGGRKSRINREVAHTSGKLLNSELNEGISHNTGFSVLKTRDKRNGGGGEEELTHLESVSTVVAH